MSQARSADDSTIPDRNVEWGDPMDIADGVIIVPNNECIRDFGIDTYLGSNMSGYVIDGVDTLIEEYATEVIDVPPYYSRYDEWTPYISEFSIADTWGIGRSKLEKIIRVATGGGRYRSGDLTVWATNDRRVIVEYSDDVWVFSMESLRRIPDDYEHESHYIEDIEVPEENEQIRNGISRFIQLTEEWYEIEIVDFASYSTNGYYFETTTDNQAYISGNNLKRLVTKPSDPDNVQDTYTIETKFGEDYELSWDEVSYDIGDECRDGRVIGYQMRWEDPRVSNRVSMSGKITASATYYYLLNREDYSSTGNDHFEVRDRSETLAEFDPQNKEWNPI